MYNYKQIFSDVDGMLICYKVSTISELYGCLTHSQSAKPQELRFFFIYLQFYF